MQWIWQLSDWPEFEWDDARILPLEVEFQHQSGRYIGAWRHLSENARSDLTIDWLTNEAVASSEIEGEILDRESVQSSIRHQFEISVNQRNVTAAESAIARMLVKLYQTIDRPLEHQSLYDWHLQLMNWRFDMIEVGRYRTNLEPMQVVSRHNPEIVHYEAPPSDRVMGEMDGYVKWFNRVVEQNDRLSILTRAGIAHLYFVCIHPFADGNGRIGRALAEKSIAQSIGQPSLINLSQQISRNRKQYYDVLETTNRSLEITRWLTWFAETVLAAQNWSDRRLIRTIEQAQMFDRLDGQLNLRQRKALLRMFKEEPDGFKGGLSAANYATITGAPSSTVTRDLSDLVAKGALKKTGERRYTRYWLNVSSFDS